MALFLLMMSLVDEVLNCPRPPETQTEHIIIIIQLYLIIVENSRCHKVIAGSTTVLHIWILSLVIARSGALVLGWARLMFVLTSYQVNLRPVFVFGQTQTQNSGSYGKIFNVCFSVWCFQVRAPVDGLRLDVDVITEVLKIEHGRIQGLYARKHTEQT